MQTTQKTLDDLATAITHCHKCFLYRQRLHAASGEGNSKAKIVFVGDAPGTPKDQNGKPFIGPAGKFLNQLLTDYGIRYDDLFLTSCVKCRPPENRTPKSEELNICVSNWLLPQLELIKPEIVVLCGRTAAGQLLKQSGKIANIHGTIHQQNGRNYFITFHPAAGMRFPNIAAAMRLDFEYLAKFMIKGGNHGYMGIMPFHSDPAFQSLHEMIGEKKSPGYSQVLPDSIMRTGWIRNTHQWKISLLSTPLPPPLGILEPFCSEKLSLFC